MNDDVTRTGQLHELRATFADSARMQHAVDKLLLSGFDRADLSLPSRRHSLDETAPESASKPVSTESDARQARTLGTSTAATVAALAAAGATIATGGAAAPAIAAAVVAGGAAGGVTFAATGAAAGSEQATRNTQAADGDLVLSVRTPTAAKQTEATAILRASGALDVSTIG